MCSITLAGVWHCQNLFWHSLFIRLQNGLGLAPILALFSLIPTKHKTPLIATLKVIYELNQVWRRLKLFLVENRTNILKIRFSSFVSKTWGNLLFVCRTIAFSVWRKPYKPHGPPSGQVRSHEGLRKTNRKSLWRRKRQRGKFKDTNILN